MTFLQPSRIHIHTHTHYHMHTHTRTRLLSGEPAWSTAPSTPTTPIKGSMKKGSYEQAIMHSDLMYGADWHGKKDKDKPLPRHIGSPNGKPVAKINSHTPTKSTIPRIPEVDIGSPGKDPRVPHTNIVMSSPEKVHMGFSPPLESTNPADLPGSSGTRDGGRAVITKPPHSSHGAARNASPSPKGELTRARAESIEEADRRRMNYVPGLAKQVLDFGGRGVEAEPYCLDIASLVRGSGGGKERSYSDSGHGESIFNVRKASITPSEVSTISVSVLTSYHTQARVVHNRLVFSSHH